MFAGGWTLEAAEAVCTGEGVEEWDILPLLSRLVDKSLVAVEPQGDSMRYSLLESLRQYSQEQAPAGIAPDALAERCAAFFLAFGADAEAHLDGPEEAAWLNRLEQEQDNIRAVLDWSLGHDQETCLRLAGHVYWLWYLRGYQSEWRSWLEAALARSQDVPAAVRAKALTAAGTLAWSQGEMDVARVWYEQALAVRKELADRREIAGALNNLGLLAAQGGDTTAAAPLLEESLDIYRVLDDRMKVATLLSNLGRMACDRKDHAVAAPLLFESRVLFRELNSLAGEAVVLGNLGEVFRLKGEYAKAVELLSSSLVHRKELGDASGVAEIWRNLGLIAFARGDATQALEYLAADHCLRVSKGMLLHPALLEESQEALDALRSQLGPSIYEDIWHQTQILPPQQFLERHRLPGD